MYINMNVYEDYVKVSCINYIFKICKLRKDVKYIYLLPKKQIHINAYIAYIFTHVYKCAVGFLFLLLCLMTKGVCY